MTTETRKTILYRQMAIGDHYQTLGVERTASSGEIRRAYLAAIRVHTPENDAEKFSELSDAYSVLANAKKRCAYDAEDRLSPDLAVAIEAASARIETNPEGAAEDLERLAEEHPKINSVLHPLGYALLKAKRPDRAVDVFKKLSARAPDNATWHVWTGIALKEMGSAKYDDAEMCFKAALSIDRNESAAYLHLAEIAAERSRISDAIAILDRGINADGEIDPKDLPLFRRKLTLLALQQDWIGLEASGNELRVALSELDEQTRAYASGFLADLGNEFIEHLKRLDLAFVMHSIASEIHPEDVDLRNHVDRTRASADLLREKNTLLNDQSVPDWIRTSIFAMCDDSDNEDKAREFLIAMVVESAADATDDRAEAVAAARRKYPNVFNALASNWMQFNSAVRELRLQHASGTRATSNSSSGCAILIAAGLFLWWISQ